MSKFKLITVSCFISFFGFMQEIEDYEYKATYFLIDYPKWSVEEIIPEEYGNDLDSLTMISYNPYMNTDLLDSINSFRVKNNVLPVEFDHKKNFSKQFGIYYNYAIDIAKIEKTRVLLQKIDEPEPKCNCINSMIEMLLDDSLEFDFGKKDYVLKERLLDKNVKRISVDYYQVIRSDATEEKNEEHVEVTIWYRYRLIRRVYLVL